MVLAGVRVIEIGQLIAGPFCGKTLADFGADVIKIEPPGLGDPLRKWRLLKDGTSVWWQVQSRNKRSVTLDLRDPECQDIVRSLIVDADVLIENFKPGTLESWGSAGRSFPPSIAASSCCVSRVSVRMAPIGISLDLVWSQRPWADCGI